MKKSIVAIIILASTVCLAQNKNEKNKADTGAYIATINFSLMNRVLSQRDVEDTRGHSSLNASLYDMRQKIKNGCTTK